MKRVFPSGCRRWRSSAGRRASDYTPDAPVVLTVEGTHGPIIHAVTEAAATRGARAGARLTDARALDPALVAVPADPDGDAALVAAARALGRPLVAAGRGRWRDGLRLDVTGVAHLFGGERGLDDDVQRRFAGIGLTARIAIAPDRRGGLGTGASLLAPMRLRRGRSMLLSSRSACIVLRPPPRPRHGAHARTAWPEDDWRADRRSAARAGAAISGAGIRRRRARPSARAKARTADRRPGRSAAARRCSARRAGDASRSGEPGARAADPRAGAAARGAPSRRAAADR